MPTRYVGVLIAESLQVGPVLDARMTVTRIRRVRPDGTSAEQPPIWTLLDIEVDPADAEDLAGSLSEVLDRPGWYADYRTDTDVYVIFPGRVFHYPRGDHAGRAEAVEFGRRLAVPESQLDWPV
ncbi:hypothetical protein [Microlunatus soli]|uniref:Uncharacterized protein n=1 Tax=Microlunatus soli TaxID=630515 RepID=A0A1H1SF14_9ACTN|nr:hypothetical protein [Microlunatus soli]SDS46316.1 hypothetical protein SAMN04489812_1983 [Microlunatus soli]